MKRGITGLCAFVSDCAFGRHANRITLSPQAFTLAFLLTANPNSLWTYDMLHDALWGHDPHGGPDAPNRVIHTRICNLRPKFETLGVSFRQARGMGYSAFDLLADSAPTLQPAATDPVPYAITYHLKPVALHPRQRTFRRPSIKGRNGCDSRLGKTSHQLVAT